MAQFTLSEHLGGHTFVPPEGPPGYTRILNVWRKPHATRDGLLAILIHNDKHWQTFFGLIGRPELAADPMFQRRMAELEVSFATVKALAADQLAAARSNGAPSLMGAAALKLRGTELQQAILQTGLDALGRHGMVFQSDALHAGWNGELIGPEESADVIYEHLYRRAATIYGGSSEVQKNIIAKGALGL